MARTANNRSIWDLIWKADVPPKKEGEEDAAGLLLRVAVHPAPPLAAGRVVTTKANKTVGVEVARLKQHPKYHRREKIKKKYQAHDPDNQFKVGDFVELVRSRPISKTKHFLAVPVPPRDTRRKAQLLPPLESQSADDSAAAAAEETAA
ncbi:30S ribosomal protein S17, chloroplastic [Triticum urartu]|uniref:Small ribosomal subunit protein uS17c n=1 Tax=Triticum urartu TaxID=4572 RepID=M7Z484_TRIUA|nr:30S ribosomal protein S17, chloroplastic [Triticum urartu]